MLLVTAAQMQELAKKAMEKFGIPGLILMENAGDAGSLSSSAGILQRGPTRGSPSWWDLGCVLWDILYPPCQVLGLQKVRRIFF